MDIIQIVSISIVSSILILLLKEQKSSLAFMLTLFTGLIIFFVLIQQISHVFLLIDYMAGKADIHGVYVETILKIIGIAYIAEFGAHLTKDAGLSSIASKIELAGKVFILLLAIPILTAVIEAILGFFPG
ncbi:stage III sporulation protein AD [Thalassobacillus pellis]|uniref:stage III sporulation protein AD n=1 Tax=Thalassobacillus pellis TaxID=748008 RepID=UPI00195F9A4B|nr:stage III sporulation protein AD [Thalassobacillus pellis]MBM7552329.1 stage III sporulation protein AD [Thalassobacillus pellis]